jgi:uncharacterized lipoprotein YddW (UPF0748 family)
MATPSRALFVSVIEKDQVLGSRERISGLVGFARQTGIRTLFVQVYRANQAWFPSTVGDSAPYRQCLKAVGEDPLARLIREAHAAGIEVHAWLNLLSLSKNTRAPLLKKYGTDILTRNLKRKRVLEDFKIDQQYFLEPGDLNVRKELSDIVAELLRRYPEIDGVQFDYIRYPDAQPDYGYTPVNMSRFRKVHGPLAVNAQSKVWNDWKRAQVTGLLALLVSRARAIKPAIHVSTTGCVSFSRAYHEAFQDWPSWVKSGLVEFVTVMNYPDNLVDFQKNIDDAFKRVPDPAKLKMGVGAYKFLKTPELFGGQLELCERSTAGGCAIFYYGNLVEVPKFGHYLRAGTASDPDF